MNIPVDQFIRYTKEHEWVRQEGDVIICGITDFAQSELGDVVYVGLPKVGTSFNQGDVFGTIEAVKALADLYMPMGGKILAVNEDLEEVPDYINEDPYETGWIIIFAPSNPKEWNDLLDGYEYQKFI